MSLGLSLIDLVALLLLTGLLAYALTGGADFGGGVWDLFATGPRAPAQRQLIEKVIAPIWEANHVWLIFVVVILFTAFPTAYARASVALHLPLVAMLLGIVMRGSAFVFRHQSSEAAARRWGRVFAVASIITPIFLGIALGAVTSGRLEFAGGIPVRGFVGSWLGPFPLAVGAFTLSLFAFLAAVYLTVEAQKKAPELAGDFRARALIAGVAVGVCALVAALVAGPGTARFADAFFHSPWTWPHQISTGIAAAGAFVCLFTRRYRLARIFAVAQVTLIVVGWALAQHPFIIAPDLTLEAAAAPAATLRWALIAYAGGAVVLIPAIYWLFRVFR